MGKRRSCPARRCRHRATRSVWSASSLLALLPDRDGSKAGASSTHSKRFAQLFSAPAVVVVVVESCHAPRKSQRKEPNALRRHLKAAFGIQGPGTAARVG